MHETAWGDGGGGRTKGKSVLRACFRAELCGEEGQEKEKREEGHKRLAWLLLEAKLEAVLALVHMEAPHHSSSSSCTRLI